MKTKAVSTMVDSSSFPKWPYFPESWYETVNEILASGQVNYHTGEHGKLFEKEFAQYCGRRYGVAVANGTVALEMSLKAYGIGEGDEVIVTPRSFLASASCVRTLGATPVFVDVDRVSQNISPQEIERRITPRTKAIITVHLAGWPCEMDEIMDIAEQKGLIVIEDCAQAHGAEYKGKKVGSLGHIAAYSFCQDKIMTTAGEGGMVLTDSEEVFKRLWAMKDHGKDYDLMYNTKHPPGFRWLHRWEGTNLRMTEIQSAIGRLALKELDSWVKARRKNAEILTECLSRFDFIRITQPPDHIYHSYYKYYCFVELDKLPRSWSRDRIIEALTASGVPCFQGSCSEIYLEESLREFKPPKRLSNAKELGETSLMFLVHPTISVSFMRSLAERIDKVLSKIKPQ